MTTGDVTTNGTSGVAGQVKDTAGQLVDQAKEQAMPVLGSQKDRAAGSIGSTADALRQTSRQLRDQDQGTIAQYLEQAADRVDEFGNYLRRRDLDGLVADAEQFARRQPGLFIGGGFMLGLLAARFLKSSSDRSRMADQKQGHDFSGRYRTSWGNTPGSSFTPSTTQDQIRTGLSSTEAVP